jgi:hypothetical protein
MNAFISRNPQSSAALKSCLWQRQAAEAAGSILALAKTIDFAFFHQQ